MAKQADKTQETVKKEVGKTYVTREFRDKDNFEKRYVVDQDISDLDKERIEELVEKGVAETYRKGGPQEPAKDDEPKK